MILTLNSLIGLGFSALVSLFVSIYLINRYLKSKEGNLGYFAGFIAFRFVMFFLFALASLVYLAWNDFKVPAVLGVIAWLAVFISVIFPAILFCHLKWPKIKNLYAVILALAGLLAVGTLIMKFSPAFPSPYPGPNTAFVALPNIVLGSLSFEFVKIYMFCKIFGVLPLALLFLIQATRGEKWLRIRSLLLGLGLLWIVSTLFVPANLTGPWGGVYSCGGDILILLGILKKAPQKV
jgi:hypothetical protein